MMFADSATHQHRQHKLTCKGLWSKLSGSTDPLRLRIALESPALAHMMCEGVSNTTTQVDPDRSNLTRGDSSPPVCDCCCCC